MGKMIPISLGVLNNMIMMLHNCTPMANDNGLIFKKLLLTIKHNGVIFHFKHIITEWCNVKHGRAVWNNWSCLRDSEKDETW